MTAPRPLVTVWTEERAESSFVILRTYAGGQVLYGPFAEDGVEAAIMHLGSALAITAMRYQTAEQLAEAMAQDGISRELSSTTRARQTCF